MWLPPAIRYFGMDIYKPGVRIFYFFASWKDVFTIEYLRRICNTLFVLKMYATATENWKTSSEQLHCNMKINAKMK